MSIDSKVEVHSYPHIKDRDVYTFDLAEGGNNPSGSKRGSHPFYEGLLTFEGREVLFILHKLINDEKTYEEVKDLFGKLYSAQKFLSTTRCSRVDSDIRINNYKDAAEIYEGLDIPPQIWLQPGGTIQNALYNRFSENAGIIVPGFLNNFTVGPNGRLVSLVEMIPKEKKSELRSSFRENNYKGPLTFWG